jgi:hypothetical protein
MKKKVFRERRKEAEGITLVNKGIDFKVDNIEVKPKKKRASKKKEA